MESKAMQVLLVAAIAFLVAGCATGTGDAPRQPGPEGVHTTTREYQLGGQGPGGGIIFYDDQIGFDFDKDGKISEDERNLLSSSSLTGARFLEAAPAGWNQPATQDEPSAEWGGDAANIAEIVDVRMTLIVGEPDKVKGTVGSGRFNTERILEYLSEHTEEEGRAAQLCADYEGGGLSDWFLPSMGELVLLHAMKDEVGAVINGGYNSSSEAVFNNLRWVVIFREDITEFDTIRKNKPRRVRPIRAF